MFVNQCFSFSRMVMVMKRDLMENWKKNLYIFLGIFLVFLGMYILIMNRYDYTNSDPHMSVDRYINSYVSVFCVITSFFLLYFSSEMMKHMRTKEERTSYLMLPATPLEKFVSRGLYVTVGLLVVIVIASLLAEVAHYAFVPFFDELLNEFKICVWPKAIEEIWNAITPFQTKTLLMGNLEDSNSWYEVEQSIFWQIAWGYSMALWFHSLFILGGNFFGKYPFLKTVATILVVGVALAFLVNYIEIDIDICIDWLNDFIRRNEDWLTEEFACGTFTFITFCFTSLNWWLSYKLFTRQQIIKPKFRLL